MRCSHSSFLQWKHNYLQRTNKQKGMRAMAIKKEEEGCGHNGPQIQLKQVQVKKTNGNRNGNGRFHLYLIIIKNKKVKLVLMEERKKARRTKMLCFLCVYAQRRA